MGYGCPSLFRVKFNGTVLIKLSKKTLKQAQLITFVSFHVAVWFRTATIRQEAFISLPKYRLSITVSDSVMIST